MRYLILVLSLISFTSLWAQTNSFQNALEKNNAEELSKYFALKVDLNLPDAKGLYNKKQAELILADFFKQNKNLIYTIKHQGGAKSATKFDIGEFKNELLSFRTYILYQEDNGSVQIIELRLEPTN